MPSTTVKPRKFYFVNSETTAEELATARGKGYRVVDERFRSEVDKELHANAKPKKSAK